jgi:hypothetical protein
MRKVRQQFAVQKVSMTSVYLASGSPRRQELLTQLGVSFERIVTGIEENVLRVKVPSSMFPPGTRKSAGWCSACAA